MTRSNRSLEINEQSPLIAAEESGDEDVEEQRLSQGYGSDLALEDSTIESKSIWYMILLTLSIGGLQIVWSVELSNGSPYLLSLGMSKALVAFVWVAGPVTGVLVQPYVGILSDRCRISWGKRKPFMLAGTLGTVGASLLLAYAKTLMSIFGGLGEDAKYEGSWKTATIVWATVMMWTLDFSINTVQAAIRAFIVDGAPSFEQERSNAYASRIVGIGNVVGYIFGYLNLPRYFHFLGDTQFKVLVAIASIVLSTTVLISCLTIKERNPQLDQPSRKDEALGFFSFFRQVFTSIRRLPPLTRRVCEIQFFHWMGWFPFLFYITTYIGQLYVNPQLNGNMSDDEVEELWARATRYATLALLVYAVCSLCANVFLPFLVVPSKKAEIVHMEDHAPPLTPTSPIGTRHRSLSQAALAHSHTDSNLSSYFAGVGPVAGSDKTAPTFINKVLAGMQVPGLTLRRTWLLAQLLFIACMLSTFFITSYTAATFMTALCGLSWSLTLWLVAPIKLLREY
jgi:solute carrier family 45, member 1/2/4